MAYPSRQRFMTGPLVECVPNISEGTDIAKIELIVNAARGIEGARVLSSEPDSDYNRTVITIAGAPQAVSEAAFRLIASAAENIDMRLHKGNHARLGAVDVCPFIPLAEISMQECAQLARSLSQRVADELGLTSYLYGAAASSDARKNHSLLRKGQYEELESRLTEGKDSIHEDETRLPDNGPSTWSEMIAKFGATIIGARDILVAYNVNLDEKEAIVAGAIGRTVRQSGPLIKNEAGQKMPVSGMLPKIQGMGFPLEEHGISQVSMNLQDISITPMHVAYETIKWLANTYGIETTGSELVGLAPLSAFLEAGAWYDSDAISEEQLIAAAVKGMGLDDLGPFIAEQRIIERALTGSV
jgi:glutamate formiminotransferase/formiminotetrahydrofolate cyclodeaminase